MLTWLLVIEAIRFVDANIADPIYETIKKHKRNGQAKAKTRAFTKKPVIGFVGKYDPQEES